MNFHMFKLGLEKAEEPEIKLPTEKAREFWKNICFIDYAKAFVWITQSVENFKEMGIPDHLTFRLRNPYVGQEVIVRTGHRTTDCFQIGKGVCQGCILSFCLFNLYATYMHIRYAS